MKPERGAGVEGACHGALRPISVEFKLVVGVEQRHICVRNGMKEEVEVSLVRLSLNFHVQHFLSCIFSPTIHPC